MLGMFWFRPNEGAYNSQCEKRVYILFVAHHLCLRSLQDNVDMYSRRIRMVQVSAANPDRIAVVR